MRNTVLLCLTCLFTLSPVAHAQLRDADSAIKHRRAAFTVMSTYFGRVISMIKGDRPFDRAELIRNLDLVQYLAKLPWEGFIPGSEAGDTRAEADIWLDEDRFKEYQQKLLESLTKFRGAANTAELPALAQSLEETRNACGACHKAFRRDW